MQKKMLIPEQNTPYFHMQSVTVTTHLDPSAFQKSLSDKEQALLKTAHEAKPRKAIAYVKKLLTKHNDQAELFNLLTYLYIKKRRLKKAHRLIEENYEKNPWHLLVRINYADLCLRRGKVDLLPNIFKPPFDLRVLYPQKTTFHLSEYRGFMTLMSYYHLATKQKEVAEAYFYLAYQVDKNHPSVQLLRKKLYHVSFSRRIKNWCGKKLTFLCSLS